MKGRREGWEMEGEGEGGYTAVSQSCFRLVAVLLLLCHRQHALGCCLSIMVMQRAATHKRLCCALHAAVCISQDKQS